MSTEFQEHWTGSAGLSEYKWGQTHTANRVPKESLNAVSVKSISFTNNTMACEIWGIHSNVAYDPRLLCHWVSVSQHSGRSLYLHHQGQSKDFLNCLILKMKALLPFKMLGTAPPTTQCYIPQDANHQHSGMEDWGF